MLAILCGCQKAIRRRKTFIELVHFYRTHPLHYILRGSDLFESCETPSLVKDTYTHLHTYLQLVSGRSQTLLFLSSCVHSWSIKALACVHRENSLVGIEINLSAPKWTDSKYGRDFPFEGTGLPILRICGMCCVSEPNILCSDDPHTLEVIAAGGFDFPSIKMSQQLFWAAGIG